VVLGLSSGRNTLNFAATKTSLRSHRSNKLSQHSIGLRLCSRNHANWHVCLCDSLKGAHVAPLNGQLGLFIQFNSYEGHECM